MRRSTEPVAAAHKSSRADLDLVEAYRRGLGLCAVAVLCRAGEIRIIAGTSLHDGPCDEPVSVLARWWCRRTAEAERVAAAAALRLRRREPRAGKTMAATAISPGTIQQSRLVSLARACIVRVATHLNVALSSDDAIFSEAMIVVARIDDEIERMQRAGELKSVNAAYRQYRIETSGRGERVLPYREWMREYRANLVRQFGATLRSC